jgi:cell division protein FtsW (lipid II flippase)
VLAGRKPPPKPKRRPRHWAEALDWVWVPRIKRAWILIPVAVSAVLIELEPDLATAMVVATTAFVMLWLGGVRTGSLIGLVVATGLVVGALVLKEPYRMERILHHGDRWEAGLVDSIGYQTTQSEAAMARGGPLGVGFTQGQAKHTLPAPTTDFVMTTVAEETGLVGSLAVFAMIGGVVWRLLALVRATTDRFGRLVLGGTATWLTVQACTNLVMANGTLPPIGVPMPFLSYGGSSLLALWLALGVCQAVAGAAAKEGSADEAGGDRRRYGRSRLSRA